MTTGSKALDSQAWLQYYPEWTSYHLDYGDHTLVSIFENACKEYASKPAYRFFGKQTTYEEYGSLVAQTAAGLRHLGVKQGDRVAILLPNCPQVLIAFYATLRLGAVPILHNPLYTASELEEPFKDHAAKVAVCWNKISPVLAELGKTTPVEKVVSVDLIEEMPLTMRFLLKLPLKPIRAMKEKLSGPAPHTIPWRTLLSKEYGGKGKDICSPKDITKSTPALILYTSGTTGTPKGAQLSHGNLVANIIQGVAWVPGLGEGEDQEKMLAALPMFHAYGMSMNGTLAPLIGGELILLPSPEMDLVMRTLKKDTPTWVPGVPTLYGKIVEEAQVRGIDIKGIRSSFSGASSLPVSIVEKWEDYTGGRLVEGYGLTETSPIIVGNPMTDDRRPGYVGIPFPDTEIRIADPEDLDKTQPDGTVGEVLVRGPQVFTGYINKPQETADSFHKDWYRTGDMGIMEEDGFIRLVSRIKEMIITGGFNVYPAEVEEALLGHELIEDVAVVGIPREDGAETVAAVIQLVEGATEDVDSFRAYAQERLTRYKVPREFYYVEELARDLTGKVRRREVREKLLGELSSNSQ